MADADSVLNFYRSLIALRNKNEAIKYGSVELLDMDDQQLFIYRRTYNGENVTVACNFGNTGRQLAEEYAGKDILLSEGFDNGTLKPFGFVVSV